MVSDPTTAENQRGSDPAQAGPRECMPCSGSGSVISNLGGEPKSVTCPWCAGTGERQDGVDAQARWPANDPAEPDAQGEPAAEPAGDADAR